MINISKNNVTNNIAVKDINESIIKMLFYGNVTDTNNNNINLIEHNRTFLHSFINLHKRMDKYEFNKINITLNRLTINQTSWNRIFYEYEALYQFETKNIKFSREIYGNITTNINNLETSYNGTIDSHWIEDSNSDCILSLFSDYECNGIKGANRYNTTQW
jgi:hypothetical protein